MVLVLAAAHGNPWKAALFAALLLVGWVVLVLAAPTRRCPKCWGHKNYRQGECMVPCQRCDMTGRVNRLGARAIHRVWWRVAGDSLMDRRKEQLKEVRSARYVGDN